ncbi:hypothetical protein HK102_006327 [Quaeritorhiza haematococci]|nr:hypothetical protein HK102_006327 [Quaeritorhiza haematococci]
MRHRLYVDSEQDPYYQLMKRAVDAANTTFKTSQNTKLTFENVNAALCIAFLIPALSQLFNRGSLYWEDVADGSLMQKFAVGDIVGAIRSEAIPGRMNETWGFSTEVPWLARLSQSATPGVPIHVLNGMFD